MAKRRSSDIKLSKDFGFGLPFQQHAANVDSHDPVKFVQYVARTIETLLPDKATDVVGCNSCKTIGRQAGTLLSALWKKDVATSDKALQALAFILEHCLRFHADESDCFSEFIEGLSGTLGSLIEETYEAITQCDESFNTNYAVTLLQQLIFIDITQGTNKLDAVFWRAPRLRHLVTGDSAESATPKSKTNGSPVLGSSPSSSTQSSSASDKAKTSQLVPEQEQCHLVAISNAPPISVKKDKTGDIQIQQGSGGLITCCEPAIKSDPQNIWLACLGPNVPVFVENRRLTSAQRSESEVPQAMLVAGRVKQFCRDQYMLHPVLIPGTEYDIYYGGISNGLLWPAFHHLPQYIAPEYKCPETLNNHWCAYMKVNFYFALDALQRSSTVDFLWVHDYHLIMLAMIIRLFNREIEIGFFLHIPFDPCKDFFDQYQPMANLLLRAMLRYSKLGFQTRRDASNFISCLQRRFPGITVISNGQNKYKIEFEGHTCNMGVFPVSVKNEEFLKFAYDAQIKEKAAALKASLMQGRPDGKLFFSAERFDYTKGIKEKLLAFEHYLKKYPERASQDRLVQVAVLNRTTVEVYKKYQDECMEIADKIQKQYKSESECPLVMNTTGMPREQLIVYYLAMDVGVVTPIKDGMNLVAKEMLLCNPRAQLVLSSGAGVEVQFSEAGFYPDKGERFYHKVSDVNNLDEFADVLYKTIDENPDSVAEHGQKLREFIVRNDIEKWRSAYLDPLWGDVKWEMVNIQALKDFHNVAHCIKKLRRYIVPNLLKGTGNKRRDWLSMESMLKSLKQSCPASTGTRIPIKLTSGRQCLINVKNEIAQLEIEMKFSKILPRAGHPLNFVQFLKCLLENSTIDKQEFVKQIKEARTLIDKGAKFKLFVSSFYGTLTRRTSTAFMSQQTSYGALAVLNFATRCTEYTAIITAAPLRNPGVVDDFPLDNGGVDFGGLMGREWLLTTNNEAFNCLPQVDPTIQSKLQALKEAIHKAAEEADFEIFTVISGGIRLYAHCVLVPQNDCYASVPMDTCNKWCSRVKEIVARHDQTNQLFQVQYCGNHLVINAKFDGEVKLFNKASGLKVYCQKRKIKVNNDRVLICGDSTEDLPLLEYALQQWPHRTRAIWVTTDVCLKHAVTSMFEAYNNKQFMFMSQPEVLLAALVEPLLAGPRTNSISPSKMGSETTEMLKN